MKNQIKNIHMVGIGGVGMSGIAEMLVRTGYKVTGSDISESKMLHRLRSLNIEIQLGHDVDLVKQADVLVYSSAIDENNLELQLAKENRIPIISRAEMLAELMRFRKGIAVAGTHGKTTTTSLLATTLSEAELDPTYVVGGVLDYISSNAYLGKGEYIIAEADESDASFLQLQPVVSVITNIDMDHMSTYKDDLEQLHQTFINFVHHLPFYGTCVMCIDDAGVQAIFPYITRRIISYGFSQEADYRIYDYNQEGTHSFFKINCRGKELGAFRLCMPGKHNVQNATVSVIIADELGVDMSVVKRALASFAGVNRRFSLQENVTIGSTNITWVDDYAHHPREIEATWLAVNEAWKHRRRVMIFQPHRYTRTRDLFDDFVRTLSHSKANLIILTEVYAAREELITGADGETLAHTLRLRGFKDVLFIPTQEELQEILPNILLDDDVVVSMGAGNISAWMTGLVDCSGKPKQSKRSLLKAI